MNGPVRCFKHYATPLWRAVVGVLVGLRLQMVSGDGLVVWDLGLETKHCCECWCVCDPRGCHYSALGRSSL